MGKWFRIELSKILEAKKFNKWMALHLLIFWRIVRLLNPSHHMRLEKN
jgi:hypothetical protein